MGAGAQEVDVHDAHVDRFLAVGLSGVGVKQGALAMRDDGQVGGEAKGRWLDARPVELREPAGLPGVAGVGQAHGVAGPAVEAPGEVDDLAALFRLARGEVLLHLVVKRGHQRDTRRASYQSRTPGSTRGLDIIRIYV